MSPCFFLARSLLLLAVPVLAASASLPALGVHSAGTAVYNNTLQYPNYFTIAEPRTVRLTTTLSF